MEEKKQDKLSDQWLSVLSNTKDAGSKYIEDTTPKVTKAVGDTTKLTIDYVSDKAPKLGKDISDNTKKIGSYISDKSKEYFPNTTGADIGDHIGKNLGIYGGAALAGLSAYGLHKYLKRRREKKAISGDI